MCIKLDIALSGFAGQAMKPWIKALADKRDVDNAKREIEGRYHQTAVRMAPSLFEELCVEIKSDLRDYASATGDRDVQIKKQDSDGMTIKRDTFPAFVIDLLLKGHIITFAGNSHNSTSSPSQPINGHIEIVSKGLDQHYYRIAGEDHHSAESVSRYILEHLLDRV